MAVEQKKHPGDYGIYSFRLDHGEKKRLSARLKRIRASINSKKTKDEYKTSTHEIIFEALSVGLEVIERKYR